MTTKTRYFVVGSMLTLAIGLGVGAQPVDQPDVLGNEPQRRRMDVEVVLLGDMEQPQDRHRILGEGIG